MRISSLLLGALCFTACTGSTNPGDAGTVSSAGTSATTSAHSSSGTSAASTASSTTHSSTSSLGGSTSSSSGGSTSSSSGSSGGSTSSSSGSSSGAVADGGIIGALTITTIGSTVDPINADANPYGLTIAPVTAGSIQAGDLLICNFNDGAGVQGNGTTIEVLHPTPGSTPTRLVQDANLQGCNALALDNSDSPWAAALVSNLNPFYTADGGLISILAQETWYGPWGQAFAAKSGPFGVASFFATNSAVPTADGGVEGNVVRIDVLDGGTTFNFDVIASGFSVNGGVPGTVLAPSGLTYDAASDTLFVVDSNVNRLVALAGVSTLPANGIVANADGSFSGSSASSAKVIYSGAPLNGPISSAELFNGDLVLGNTLDPDGQNLLVEITQSGHLAAVQNLDTGAAGALFGIVATGTNAANVKIYFNDDNDNTVKLLAP